MGDFAWLNLHRARLIDRGRQWSLRMLASTRHPLLQRFGRTITFRIINDIPSVEPRLFTEVVVQLQGRFLFGTERVPVFPPLWDMLRQHNDYRAKTLHAFRKEGDEEGGSAYCTGSGEASMVVVYRATQASGKSLGRSTE